MVIFLEKEKMPEVLGIVTENDWGNLWMVSNYVDSQETCTLQRKRGWTNTFYEKKRTYGFSAFWLRYKWEEKDIREGRTMWEFRACWGKREQ